MKKKTKKNLIEIILTIFFWGFVVFIIFMIQLYADLWLRGSSNPQKGIKYTNSIEIEPVYTKKFLFNMRTKLYYVDNYPVLCVSNKSNNKCILLEELHGKKLGKCNVIYVFFKPTITATVQNMNPTFCLIGVCLPKVFNIDYNSNDFGYYYLPDHFIQ